MASCVCLQCVVWLQWFERIISMFGTHDDDALYDVAMLACRDDDVW